MEKLNKVLLVIVCILLFAIIVLCFYGLKDYNSFEIKLNDDLTGEVGYTIKPSNYIKEITNATIKEDNEVYLDKIGEKLITVKLLVNNKEKDYDFKIKVIDKSNPIIKKSSNEITVLLNEKIDLEKLFSVEDNSNEDIKVSIEGDYNINKVGKYKLEVSAKDSSGNTTIENIVLNVTDKNVDRSFVTSLGFKGEVKDGITYIDGILIANKTYSLPSKYGDGLKQELSNAFSEMQKGAKEKNYNLFIISGFRSYQTQKKLYNQYVEEDGKENADTYSARPGRSEHQSGYAIDINSINESFGNTKTGKWVANNCYKYGFILRYPKGKENITGYIYEPWHLRYVGESLAEKLYNNGDWITLEEYFGIDSKYSE